MSLLYHTICVAVVTPNDRPKSVRNRCVIEVFGGVLMLSIRFFFFFWYTGFSHRTESDLFFLNRNCCCLLCTTKNQLVTTKNQQTVVFGDIIINMGSAYSPTTGRFTAPTDGVYGFAWTVVTDTGSRFHSELVVDGQTKLYMYADGTNGARNYAGNSCTGVLQLKAGQQVWVRTSTHIRMVLKSAYSSFSGWKIQ